MLESWFLGIKDFVDSKSKHGTVVFSESRRDALFKILSCRVRPFMGLSMLWSPGNNGLPRFKWQVGLLGVVSVEIRRILWVEPG